MGEASTSQEVIALVMEWVPGVVLLDVRLGEGTGFEVARGVKAQRPSVRILALTAFENEHYLHSRAKLGVDSYVLKTMEGVRMRHAVLEVAGGSTVYPPSSVRKILCALG